MTGWLVVAGAGLATVILKGAGPLLLGGRTLPAKVTRVLAMLAPAMLAALVAVQTFGANGALVLDARAAGVGAAGVAILLRAPLLAVVAAAAATTAIVRLLGG